MKLLPTVPSALLFLILSYGNVSNGDGLSLKAVKDSAKLGQPLALRTLGILYENGEGVQKDYAKAREYYLKAVDKGDAQSCVYIGTHYDSGYGVSVDWRKAYEWYQRASEMQQSLLLRNCIHYSLHSQVPHKHSFRRENDFV